jgi:hypothetical protein
MIIHVKHYRKRNYHFKDGKLMKLNNLSRIFLIFICFFTFLNLYSIYNTKNLIIARAELSTDPIKSQDLIIDISKNASAIGPHSILQFSVELTNILSESLYNVSVSLIKNNDLMITPDSDPLYTTSSVDPDSSIDFQFVTQFNEESATPTSTVDLILMIDASGSMGEEIDSVKQELNDLTATLQTEIPELRIGVIVYGWSRYSEYPMSNPNNYIQFTNDFDSIKTFINSLYAAGGNEPWGDALYLASTWDWREHAAKLIILVGDEDCDPGVIIGSESRGSDPGGTYNGSELLDVVTTLKNEGVVISTVVCGGASTTTEHQFQWIASFTEGTSVYLPDFENEGISLPQIIQEWTLEMSREHYREINLTVLWQDASSTRFFNTQSSSFWLDFSSPSTIISETISPTGVDLFSVDFLIEAQDISPISFVTLYHNAYGSWDVEFLTPIENTSYYRLELQNVRGGVNLSYFVECADVLHNVNRTSIFWVIVEPKFDSLGEEVAIWAENDDQIYSNLRVDQKNSYYFILIGPPDIDLLSVNLLDLSSNNSVNPVQIEFVNASSSWHKIFQFDLTPANHSMILSIPSGSNNFTMTYVWITFNEPEDDVFEGSMTNTIRVYGIQWEAINSTYFSFEFNASSPLVLVAEVFTSNWTFISSFGVTSSFTLTDNDTYIILVWATLRTGDFVIKNTDTPPDEIYDPYYAHNGASATFYPGAILTVFLMIMLVFYRKKAKRRE